MIPLLTGFGNGRARRRAWPKFARPTLWLYGQQDSFYSIEHSRSNFDAFEKAGGIGEFFEFVVPGGSGHRLTGYPSLWTGAVEKYLIAIGTPQSQ